MTQKETREIALSISTLLSDIIKEDAQPETVANSAIHFCVNILKQFPEINEQTDQILENRDWDDMICWFRFKKEAKL